MLVMRDHLEQCADEAARSRDTGAYDALMDAIYRFMD